MNKNSEQSLIRDKAAAGDGQSAVVESVVERGVEVWQNQKSSSSVDNIINEVAVALVYNGVSHAVMMATPLNLEAFALGFSLTEGIVDCAADIYEIQVDSIDEGIEVSVTISSQCFARLKDKRRNLSGRTGCGICGAESLQQVHLSLSKVIADFCISHEAIDRATRDLNNHQPLQELTGATHGAAWCNVEGKQLLVCEDVGRHNALDKLVGLLLSQELISQEGFLLISSRASYEILQKSAMANIGIVVAMSAPTSLAIDIADQTGITLIGFSRENRHVVYSNSARLLS